MGEVFRTRIYLKATLAFALAEALVAMLVVAVLMGLMIPTLISSQNVRDDVTCTSNLQQIGFGIIAYAGDHNGYLPGPLLVGQYPYWENGGGGDSKVLATYLENYLSLKTRLKKGVDVFNCPANRRMVVNRPEETPVFMLNTEVPMNGRTGPQAPFGYPNTYYDKYRYNLEGGILRNVILKDGQIQDEPPMSLPMLNDIVDSKGQPARATTWALKDIDQLEPILEREKSSYRSRVPNKMAHRTHRNALFFDFRVGQIDQDNQPR